MKTLLAILGVMAAMGGPGWAAPGRDNPATGSAASFFGATHLDTFHLTIAPDQWAIMDQLDRFKANADRAPGPNDPPDRRGPARPPGQEGNGPGGGPRGNGRLMGVEFQKGTAHLEFNGQPCGSIRVRFKGNSSFNFARNSLKRSLKLDFNDLEKGHTFFGLTKLNLNNNAMDPSQLREALAYDILRHGGVPAGRTAFARVYLTVPGEYAKAYAGLYTVVEQVDERFLKDHFDTKKGMLLKPERVPGLPFLGRDWAAYTNRLTPKTTVTAEEAGRFMDMAQWLNSADNGRFQSGLESFVEVDEFLRFLALQALLSNLDSPLLTGHNYYLYLHPKTHQFVWIPWDLNEAFGGFAPGGDPGEQMNLSVDHPYSSVNRMAERVLQSPGIKLRYHQIMRGLLATNFNATRLFPIIDAMAATVRPALAGDPMVSLPQFEASLAETISPETLAGDNSGGRGFRRGGPGGPGGPRRPRIPLKAFIQQRVESVQFQLEGKTDGYEPREMRRGPNGPRPDRPPMGPPL